MGKQESGFALKKEVKLFHGEEELKIGSLSQITSVKAGTIRFYEKCGFLESAKRLPNGYRVFCGRHIYQIRVCRLVFGGFVNRRTQEASRKDKGIYTGIPVNDTGTDAFICTEPNAFASGYF